MRRRLRQNATNVSEIYIGCPIYISDVQYIYPTSDIQYPTSARASARARAGISDVRYRYRTSDIDIGRRIWYPDVGYRYPDVGYRYPDVRYRYPDVGYRYPDVGYRYPDVGYRYPDVG